MDFSRRYKIYSFLVPMVVGIVLIAQKYFSVEKSAVISFANDVLIDVSKEVPIDMPNDVPIDIPNDAAIDVPNDATIDVPNDVSVNVPNDVPNNVVNQINQAAGASQPHILFFLADDYGWNDVGYHGSEIHTPHMDKLAKDGVKLENYYVQNMCSPTRGSLLSGRYQIHTGLQHGFIVPTSPECLLTNIPTIADLLKVNGYSTHIVGKWHLGFSRKECTPTFRGFDTFFGFLLGDENYYTHSRDEGYDFHNITQSGKEQCTDKLKGKYSTHLFATRAQEIANQHIMSGSSKPLFTYVPFQAVHNPLQVPQKYIDRYGHIKDGTRKTYAGMVAAMDEAIGNITQTYKDLGLWDNTIVVFSTDNGGAPGAGGYNWPLRGRRGTLWEGGVRAVGFVSGGLIKNKGIVNKELIDVSDWFPTFVNLAGGSVEGLGLDGYDVWNTISTGSKSPRSEIVHNIDPLSPPHGESYPDSPFDTRKSAAIRYGNYKLITGKTGEAHWLSTNPSETITSLDQGDQNVLLFDIDKDPYEKKDLSRTQPEIVMQLLKRLAYHNSTAVKCTYQREDPQANPALHGGYWVPWLD